MSTKNTIKWFVTLLAVGAGTAWLLKRRGDEVPGLSSWERVLTSRHGALKAAQLVNQVQLRYTGLLTEQPLPANRALRRHVASSILPGLALYQVLLQEHSGNQQAALLEMDEAFRYATLKKSRVIMAPFKLMPDAFGLFKLMFGQMMKSFPSEGWDFEFLENSDNRIAFNGTRCFYLNTLTLYGAPELTASFCKTDDVMAELFPPFLRCERTKTLGRGDDVCDFQYCHVRRP